MISFLLMEFLTCFRPLSEETVRDLALKSPTKSCALYPIFTGLLKAGIDSLVPLTTCIVNDSLESGTVRDVLKQAIVTPLLKKPSLDSNMLKKQKTTDLCLISHSLKK